VFKPLRVMHSLMRFMNEAHQHVRHAEYFLHVAEATVFATSLRLAVHSVLRTEPPRRLGLVFIKHGRLPFLEVLRAMTTAQLTGPLRPAV
jgi:hypothetical protein